LPGVAAGLGRVAHPNRGEGLGVDAGFMGGICLLAMHRQVARRVLRRAARRGPLDLARLRDRKVLPVGGTDVVRSIL